MHTQQVKGWGRASPESYLHHQGMRGALQVSGASQGLLDHRVALCDTGEGSCGSCVKLI